MLLVVTSAVIAVACGSTSQTQGFDDARVGAEASAGDGNDQQNGDGSHKGGFPGTDECCPRKASDCGDINCCGSTACGAASGRGTCRTLPPSCNGQVSADCDDFPEDCDEPCCLCSQCP